MAKTPEQDNALKVTQRKDESQSAAIARTFIQPELSAAGTQQQLHNQMYPSLPVNLNDRISALTEQISQTQKGSMERPEAILITQAHTLDMLFNGLTQKALNQDQLKHYETFFRLALKAQAQCRATLETLSNIKNPPVIFAKQANISNGHQQVNNGVAVSHTAEKQNQQNELLEHTHGERLDNGTKGETIRVNSELAALG